MNRRGNIALLFSILSVLLICTSDSRAGGIDVIHYDLALKLQPPVTSFSGSVGVKLRTLGETKEVRLNASKSTLTIDSVQAEGHPLTYAHRGDSLAIRLFHPLNQGDTIGMTIYFHGVSAFDGRYDNGGILFTEKEKRGRAATISEPFFARTWWPCKDDPSDKATFDIRVVVPNGLTAVSNGLLTDTSHQGDWTVYHWKTNYPTCTYLIAVSVAEYSHRTETYRTPAGSTMPLEFYTFPEDSLNSVADFGDTQEYLRYLSSNFGEYPFIGEKLGLVETSGDLTMENQTICSIQQSLIDGKGTGSSTIFHEIAHQWWGDLISPTSWHHTWLNEGFAAYAELLWSEHRIGRVAYDTLVRNAMSPPNGTYAGSVIGKSDTSFWDSFSPRVYTKGSLVLHMLRRMSGDSIFFAGMRAYLNDPSLRYANATTEDFIRNYERIARRDLRWFFDQWIYASTDSIDRPELTYRWIASARVKSFDVRLTITQHTARVKTYRLPFNVTLRTGGRTLTVPVVDSLATQVVSIRSPFKPEHVVLDENHDVFMIVKQE